MEFLVMLGLLFVVVAVAGAICGIVALNKVGDLQAQVRNLLTRLHLVERRAHEQETRPAEAEPPPLELEPEPPRPPAITPLEPEPPKPSAARLAKGLGAPPAPPPPMIEPLAPEPAPPGPPAEEEAERWAAFEEWTGKRLMTWAGAVVLLLSAAFFVKYAIDRDWLDARTRDIIGMAFGALLVGAGVHFVRQKMTALGQGLIGGGLGILYLSLYAAYGYHAWMSQNVAFGAMALVSAAGLTLSVVFDAVPISFIAILGGLLTPVLVSTGADERDLLFAYLMLLDLTVLAVAFFKRWRSLDVLAFVGTAVLFLMWFFRHYPAEYDLPYLQATMFWLGGFFLVFLVLPFAHHMRRKTPITVERFVMALTNATGVCTLAYYIMYRHHQHALGYCVLGMSAAYLVLGALCRWRLPEDTKSPFGFLGLAIVFFTISIPLHFGLNGVTVCWAAEAPLLLYLGYRYRYRPVRLAGFGMLIVLLGRFFLRHWPLHGSEFELFLNASFAMAMTVVLSGAAYALVHQWQRKESGPDDHYLKVMSSVLFGFLGLVFVNAEIAQWFHFTAMKLSAEPEYFSRASSAILWALGAAAFLACGLRIRSGFARVAGLLALVIAAVIAIILYPLDGPVRAEALLNLRFGAALVVVLATFACGVAFWLTGKRTETDARAPATGMHLLAGLALLVLLSAETFTYAHHLRAWSWSTVVWGLGAAGFMAAGIFWKSAAARAAGRVALGMAVLGGIVMYAWAPGGWLPRNGDWALFFNERFAAVLVAVAVAFAYPGVLIARASICLDGDRPKVSGLFSRAAALLLVLLTAEILTYSGDYGAWCAVVLLLAASGAALLVSSLATRTFAPAATGVFAVVASFITALRLYAMGAPDGYLLFLNLRFFVCLAGALLLFAVITFRRAADDPDKVRPAVGTVAALLLLMLLSAEPYLYCVRTITDAAEAAWSSRMALTIVWSAYATVMLAIGFRLKNRSLRFAALALFGITGVKLVAVDFAGLQQVYRIISFFVMGLLMIAASYLYHKVEKRLAAAEEAETGSGYSDRGAAG